MAIQKTQAVVLRATKLRETSLIVTFFSHDFGKLQGLAKGVRQAGSPWAGLYEPMNRLEIIFYEKFRSDIYLVTEASGLDLRGELRKNFTATCYGYYLTEVLENFANTGEPDPAYWDLLEKAYGSLSGHPLFVSLVFQLKLLHHAGFLPDLQTVETRMEGKPGHLNPALIQNLRYLVKEEWGKALRLQMNKKDLEEAETLVAYLVSAKLEKNLKSRRFLNEINQS